MFESNPRHRLIFHVLTYTWPHKKRSPLQFPEEKSIGQHLPLHRLGTIATINLHWDLPVFLLMSMVLQVLLAIISSLSVILSNLEISVTTSVNAWIFFAKKFWFTQKLGDYIWKVFGFEDSEFRNRPQLVSVVKVKSLALCVLLPLITHGNKIYFPSKYIFMPYISHLSSFNSRASPSPMIFDHVFLWMSHFLKKFYFRLIERLFSFSLVVILLQVSWG